MSFDSIDDNCKECGKPFNKCQAVKDLIESENHSSSEEEEIE